MRFEFSMFACPKAVDDNMTRREVLIGSQAEQLVGAVPCVRQIQYSAFDHEETG